MLLFVLPFAVPVLEASLLHRGLDMNLMIPDALEGFIANSVSLAGLLLLALHERRL